MTRSACSQEPVGSSRTRITRALKGSAAATERFHTDRSCPACWTRSAPPGRSDVMWIAISGSRAGLVQPAGETDAPDCSSAPSVKNPTSGPSIPRFAIAAGMVKQLSLREQWTSAGDRTRGWKVVFGAPAATRGSSQTELTTLSSIKTVRSLSIQGDD
jgi:hypothetical protein